MMISHEIKIYSNYVLNHKYSKEIMILNYDSKFWFIKQLL